MSTTHRIDRRTLLKLGTTGAVMLSYDGLVLRDFQMKIRPARASTICASCR
jgi:hypothetical protein